MKNVRRKLVYTKRGECVGYALWILLWYVIIFHWS